MIRTIEVEIPDFCQEECAVFELEEERLGFFEGNREVETFHLYRCKHEDFCRKTHKKMEENDDDRPDEHI